MTYTIPGKDYGVHIKLKCYSGQKIEQTYECKCRESENIQCLMKTYMIYYMVYVWLHGMLIFNISCHRFPQSND